ncbi:MAG TPA: hypothetical protein VIS29_14305 [Streptomyces sp.]
MLRWAGWDHKDQAQALFELLAARTTRDGWSSDRIVPLLAGLREVMPWVRQWHGEYDTSAAMFRPASRRRSVLVGQQGGGCFPTDRSDV